jgi:hypothetical protein
MDTTPGHPSADPTRWYDLFSRGARDWLRHNQKVRASVREALPDLVAQADLAGPGETRSIRVPVRLLEHYRFRLRETETTTGAGQGGGVRPGDVLREGRDERPGAGASGAGGSGGGGVELVLEIDVSDLLDWLWEELRLPRVQPRPANVLADEELVREGWDRRGARSRLDRRRTIKEAVKRRAAQPVSPAITDEDLRFRQIALRRRPTTQAAIVFVLDVSSSMGEDARKLAKNFFFWALQGLRRQYRRIETAFVAHTVEAWELQEAEFFQVRASGGTRASVGLERAAAILRERFDPARYNDYVFYASDGDNFPEDREAARSVLATLADLAAFSGYLEVADRGPQRLETELAALFADVEARAGRSRVGSYTVHSHDELWAAVRRFFVDQVAETA